MDYVEQRMAQEAQKDVVSSPGLATPLNMLLLAVVLYTAYVFMRPAAPPALAKDPPAIVFRTFTPRSLLPLNGTDGQPVYLAVRGRVFDVSSGRNFYGPGGMYENFAGRDASRGLSKHSFDEDMLTKDLDGPLDPLDDLDADELEALRGWEERFEGKYLVVGRLVSAAEYAKIQGDKA
ncbi:DNA damage response protein [Grosmannia clavigera kw1407]|uniref:DNA damage response protein n=1 Tax=Grosmannia clavigera (strain kw1407 / UAMH 11150) TaxID=655863 RepID=F0XIQ5_GROCL|nr:DNA damage response protein [Grosmannia clavigera kw1407]EFX02429.1 DNA damage response protein [Grosmannia clavigera kw1407]